MKGIVMKFSITGDENSLDVSFTLDDGSVLSKHYNGKDPDAIGKNGANTRVGTFAYYVTNRLELQKAGYETDTGIDSNTAQFDYIDAEGKVSNVKVDLNTVVEAKFDYFTIRRDDGSYRKYRYDRIIDGVVKLN